MLVIYFALHLLANHDTSLPVFNDKNTAPIERTLNAMHHTFYNVFSGYAVMFFGFLLMFDVQRGLSRALISLPITAKQIGRAWWLAAVALPAIALAITSLLALLIFPSRANELLALKNCLFNWVLTALYFGAMFGSLTFMNTTMSNVVMNRLYTIPLSFFFPITIMGFIFVQFETLSVFTTVLIFAAYLILAVLGWFRAERMVMQRAAFKLVTQSVSTNQQSHRTPQGFGGLSYFVQKTFSQTTLIGLAIVGWMAFTMSFFHFFHDQSHAQTVTSMVDGGSIPYIFVLLFGIISVVGQLRFLRTLPIGSATLAATMVVVPVVSIAVIGLIVTTLATFVAGEAVISHTANAFLMLGAKAAIMVPIIVWRGLGVVTYFLVFLMAISDSFIKLALTIMFHLGSNTPEHSLWISLIILLAALAVSFVLTQRLLTKSNSAYHVRTMPQTWWSMMRR